MWGPLGNGFPPTATEHLVMVAGGIGQTPFLALAREYLGLHAYGDPARAVPRAKQVTLCYGVRRREYLAGVEDFRRAGVEVQLEHRRRLAGPSRTGDRVDPPGGGTVAVALSDRLLRAGADDAIDGQDCPAN